MSHYSNSFEICHWGMLYPDRDDDKVVPCRGEECQFFLTCTHKNPEAVCGPIEWRKRSGAAMVELLIEEIELSDRFKELESCIGDVTHEAAKEKSSVC